MKRLVLIGLAFVVAFSMVSKAAPASAQTIGVGYQFLDDTTGSESFPVGLDGNISFPFMGPWSWVGDVSWNHKTIDTVGFTFFSAGGGVKFTFPSVKALSVQGLAGIAHSSSSVDGFSVSSTDFMIQPGAIYTFPAGGFDIFVGGHFRHVFASGGDDAVILQAGVMFGKK